MATRTGASLRAVEGLHASEVGQELVLVDERSQQAHSLTGVAAQVFRAVEARTAVDLDDEQVAAAVAELETRGLVHRAGISRRSVLSGAGKIAVAGTIITIALPEVQAAASSGPNLATASLTYDNTKSAKVNEAVTLVGSAGAVTGTSMTITAVDDKGNKLPVTNVVATGTGSWTFKVTNSGPNTAVTITAAFGGDANYQAHTYIGTYTVPSTGGGPQTVPIVMT
jgi:hypothetical protein